MSDIFYERATNLYKQECKRFGYRFHKPTGYDDSEDEFRLYNHENIICTFEIVNGQLGEPLIVGTLCHLVNERTKVAA